ncbi:MAG: hypothetical protein HOP17_01925 [Acidobacteria bacterium]|nr:hypothetical protein [Acidobacteriota bacterium]
MQTCLNNLTSTDRYDDGLSIDYAMMIRLWSSIDRSVAAFNRRCGVLKPSSRDIARLSNDGKKESRSK